MSSKFLVGATVVLAAIFPVWIIWGGLDLQFSVGLIAVILLVSLMVSILGNPNDVFAPPVIIGLFATALYVWRPLMIGAREEWGLGLANTMVLTGTDRGTLLDALLIALLGILSFAVGYYLIVDRSVPVPKLYQQRTRFYIKASRIALVGSLCLAIAVLANVYIIQSNGGLSQTISQIGVRQTLQFQRGYLFLAAGLAKPALFVVTIYFFCFKHSPRSLLGLVWLSLAIVALAADLLYGSRSALISSNLLILLAMFHYCVRPLSWRFIFVAGVVSFLVFFVGFRVLTRDVHFQGNQNETTTEILQSAITDLPSFMAAGGDVNALDGLMLVTPGSGLFDGPYKGSTLAAVITAPIPRSWWPEKPLGANAVFTQEFYPERYSVARVEYGVSFLGELMMNFGAIGVPFGMGLLGAGIATLRNIAFRSQNPLHLVIYLIVLFRTISLFRGDLFNTSITTLSLAIPVVAIYGLVTGTTNRRFSREGSIASPPRRLDQARRRLSATTGLS